MIAIEAAVLRGRRTIQLPELPPSLKKLIRYNNYAREFYQEGAGSK
jgi:hypothetical protein